VSGGGGGGDGGATCRRRLGAVRSKTDGLAAAAVLIPLARRCARTPPLSPEPRAPVSAAGVGVCGGGYPRVSRPRALRTTPSPSPIYGFPTTKHTRIYPLLLLLLLLRSHAATAVV